MKVICFSLISLQASRAEETSTPNAVKAFAASGLHQGRSIRMENPSLYNNFPRMKHWIRLVHSHFAQWFVGQSEENE